MGKNYLEKVQKQKETSKTHCKKKKKNAIIEKKSRACRSDYWERKNSMLVTKLFMVKT